ncbi:MAG TPA: TetR/AcrR family transcriptional regulator [Bacteroidales bacterium]|nr:TetR/AcrR family transcriptional regulator [Bacteroidales bacterium]
MENTRDYIIDEAFKLFLTRSYEAVSISDVSAAAGLTKGALYHHFKNKEDLYKSVIDKYLSLPENTLDISSISLLDYLNKNLELAEKVIERLFGTTSGYEAITFMALFIDAFRHYPGYSSLRKKYFEDEVGKIKKVLENSQKSGEIKKDIDCEIIAATFFSINLGIAGDLVANNSTTESLRKMKAHTYELYKLIKT